MSADLGKTTVYRPALGKEELRIRLLVVDDEQSIRKLCMTVGEALGFICLEADSGESALALLEEQPVHMILSDMVMPQMSGLEFLERVKKLLPRTEVALMTGHGSIETAVQSMRLGAYDYITKPFSPLEELRLFLRRMAEKIRLVEENEFLRERMDSETAVHGIIGSSAKIQEVLRVASRLKDTRTSVLISGESGTGKELIARAIHFRGAFANRPFVAVDCGSLVPTLIESELFGYEKGAFTGALKSKQGLFQSADTGSVFLDEIGELPLELQAKLLRVLQEKEVRPVGSNQRVKVDVRIIAATNRDLEAAYKNGTFRKDLYFRLNVVTVHVPALRERRSDIPMLVQWFCERYAPGADLRVSNAAMKALMNYDWPGNVRELENCIERAVALGDGTLIDLGDLPPSLASLDSRASRTPSGSAPELVSDLAAAAELRSTDGAASTPLSTTDLEDIERATIQRVFEQVKGDKALAGRMLGISRATLYRKLKRYNITGSADTGASSHTLQ
ncbi:MAG TPA: sigma-54 dependent transcriptional regulator [Candidatus Polarisedimenticolia bacterium]|nr:sigma-54 dependent transcriptional regulator [Candidatus Polarisedimenticolia bacterium]